MVTSRIGMSAKSSDPEFDELNRFVLADGLKMKTYCRTELLSIDDSAAWRPMPTSCTRMQSVSGIASIVRYAHIWFFRIPTYRRALTAMVNSSSAFAEAFLAIFTPGGTEYDLESRYPGAAETIKQIGSYQTDMAELKETLAPEVELIETRIIAPAKEFIDLLKKIRKTITKRDHKVSLQVQSRSFGWQRTK